MNYSISEHQEARVRRNHPEIRIISPLKSQSKLFSKSSRNLNQTNVMDVSPTLSVSPKLMQHKRSFSTKTSPLRKMQVEETADESLQLTRQDSSVSMRSSGRTLSKFHSRAPSIDKRLQPGMQYYTASSPGHSRPISLADFGQNSHVHSELLAIRNRSEELAEAIVAAIKAHHNQLEELMRGVEVQIEEDNNDSELDDKVREVLEIIVGETTGLGTIEWENKFESLKKELQKLSSRNEQIVQSLKESQSTLQEECSEHSEIIRILTSNSSPQSIVQELTNLLETKKKKIQQLDAERGRSEKETKNLRVLFKRKEEEIALWNGKAERYVKEIKEREHQIRESGKQLSSLKWKIDSKTRETSTLLQSHQRSKEEITANYAKEITSMESEISGLVDKTKSIDDIYDKLEAQEREVQRLTLELQASAQEIKRLTEENEKEQSAAEEKIRLFQKKHEAQVSALEKEHQTKMRLKNREVQFHKAQLEQLQKESVERQSIIQKLTSETELLKRKAQEQGSSMKVKEEKYKVEISQLKRKVADMSEILNHKGESRNSKDRSATNVDNRILN